MQLRQGGSAIVLFLARSAPLFLAFLALGEKIPPDLPPDVHSVWTLQYGVEWRLVRAGTAKLTWTPRPQGFQGDVHLESAGLVSKLFRVNDDYRTLVDEHMCASSTSINAEEGKRRRQTSISFAGGKASYLEKDLVKNAVVLTIETPVPACVFEYFAGLNHLRSLRIEPGQSTQVAMSDGKRVANVRVEALDREEVRTPAGAFKTIRYEIHLFNDVLVNKKARLFIWISEDAKRIPVQMQAKMHVLIGTINLQLEKEGT